MVEDLVLVLKATLEEDIVDKKKPSFKTMHQQKLFKGYLGYKLRFITRRQLQRRTRFMGKLIYVTLIMIVLGSLARAGIQGVQITGTVYSFNKEVVVLHQKGKGLAVTIPRNLVKQRLRGGEKITVDLTSAKEVVTNKIRNKASKSSRSRQQ